LLPASFGYLSCELYWLLYMSKTPSRYSLVSGSVQLDSPSALRGEGDDVVVKIVFLAPIDACRLVEGRAIVSHLDSSTLRSELISTANTHMDSAYPQSPIWRSDTNSCSSKKQASLSTTTSGHMDPMKPPVLLFGSGSTDAGFTDDRVSTEQHGRNASKRAGHLNKAQQTPPGLPACSRLRV
jgi:hypothetical protein